jgi:hypothetical protein
VPFETAAGCILLYRRTVSFLSLSPEQKEAEALAASVKKQLGKKANLKDIHELVEYKKRVRRGGERTTDCSAGRERERNTPQMERDRVRDG